MAGLLLPVGLADTTLHQVAAGLVDSVAIETVTFPEGGGAVDLEFAVPFLPGMDDVVVDTARLVLRAVDTELPLNGWHVVPGPAGQGAFVVLDEPSRLRTVVIDQAGKPPGAYLVVRAASVGAGGAATAGAPLFADRRFETGPMFPLPLAGMSVVRSADRATLRVPTTSGQAWLIQYASGDTPAALAPADGRPQVFDVAVAPAASDVSLVLRAADGTAEQPLWQHPGALLPGAGEQLADFTPAAGRRLAGVLSARNAAGGTAATLPLPLRFRASGPGTLTVADRILDVRYVARPVGRDSLPVALHGDWAPLCLDAPTRAPSASVLRLRGRHRGLVVNPGSGVPPLSVPGGGVRVRAGRVVAAPVSWLVAGDRPPPLAAIRLLARPLGDTELVCDVRRDGGRGPGAVVAGPLVARLPAAASTGWVSLPLPAATPVAAPAALWVTARTNRGELDWFTFPGAAGVRVSDDGGTSWGDADAALADPGLPCVQLLHAVDPATQPPPVISVRNGDLPLGSLALTPGATPGEYAVPVGTAVPQAILAALVDPAGPARRTTTLALWSPELLDLTVTELTLSYDPFS